MVSPCNIVLESSLNALDFMNGHFLTAMTGGEKITAMGRKRILASGCI